MKLWYVFNYNGKTQSRYHWYNETKISKSTTQKSVQNNRIQSGENKKINSDQQQS